MLELKSCQAKLQKLVIRNTKMFLKKKIESSVAIGIIVIVSIATAIVLINEGEKQVQFYDNYYDGIGVK